MPNTQSQTNSQGGHSSGLTPILSEESMKKFSSSVSDLSTQVKEASSDLSGRAVTFFKKYPLHCAIGTGVVGFVAGMVSGKVK